MEALVEPVTQYPFQCKLSGTPVPLNWYWSISWLKLPLKITYSNQGLQLTASMYSSNSIGQGYICLFFIRSHMSRGVRYSVQIILTHCPHLHEQTCAYFHHHIHIIIYLRARGLLPCALVSRPHKWFPVKWYGIAYKLASNPSLFRLSMPVLYSFLMTYVLRVLCRTFKGCQDVRPKVLCTYVLRTSARTSIERLNENERKLSETPVYWTKTERFRYIGSFPLQQRPCPQANLREFCAASLKC